MTASVKFERLDFPTIFEADVWHEQEAMAADAFGLPAAGMAAPRDGGAILSVGPNRYYFVGEKAAATAAQIGPSVASVVDLSSARTRFRLTGPDSAWTINKGSSVDLRARACPPNKVLMTSLGHISVTVHQNARVSDDCFDLYCYASFADALQQWLVTAVRG